jgi:hypothetical protein
VHPGPGKKHSGIGRQLPKTNSAADVERFMQICVISSFLNVLWFACYSFTVVHVHINIFCCIHYEKIKFGSRVSYVLQFTVHVHAFLNGKYLSLSR